MWGSSGHGTKQIAGVNFAIGVCARLNIRNMIPVLSLGVRRIGTCNLFYCLRKYLFYGTFNALTSLFFIFCFLRFCNFKDQIKTKSFWRTPVIIR